MIKPWAQSIIADLSDSAKNLMQTVVICCFLYTGIIWVIGQVFVPDKAEGSLILNGRGEVTGSRLLAQSFTDPGYFWSRPSAVDYNAAGSGGSNLSPTNPALRRRIRDTITRLQPSPGVDIPTDLVMTSGSGLDPNISLPAALFQVERVARARKADPRVVNILVRKIATKANPILGKAVLVNVLNLNLLIDQKLPYKK